jgi:hypothetical protein
MRPCKQVLFSVGSTGEAVLKKKTAEKILGRLSFLEDIKLTALLVSPLLPLTLPPLQPICDGES